MSSSTSKDGDSPVTTLSATASADSIRRHPLRLLSPVRPCSWFLPSFRVGRANGQFTCHGASSILFNCIIHTLCEFQIHLDLPFAASHSGYCQTGCTGLSGLTDPEVQPNSSSDSENETVGGELQRNDHPTSLGLAVAFTLTELVAATNNFNVDCVLGEGGFGRIYKGKLKCREGGFGPIHIELMTAGYVVAIRRLHPIVPEKLPEFCNEVTMLSELDSLNIVNLFGYCIDEGQRFLVYEYMTNGSLEDHLFRCGSDMKPLDWRTRMEIASDVANGLYYLHAEHRQSIIHRNLKCSNILLGEKYRAKLSDFGLTDRQNGFCVREFPEIGKVSYESDIYAFGVVLLEIITGKRAFDRTGSAKGRNLVAWAQPFLKDRNIVTQMADKSLEYIPEFQFEKAAFLAKECLHNDPRRRPQLDEIKKELSSICAYLLSGSQD